jgi:hypothetical protein
MKKILVGLAGLLVLGSLALAQVPGLFIASPTGLEQINVLVPSTSTAVTNPQIQTITVNQLRNAAGVLLVPTGTTVNTTVPSTASRAIATGAITTWNITFPTAPYDGEMLEVSCPGGTATVAMTATLPASVAVVGTAFTACTSGGAAANTAEWIYSIGANTWYRIQ